MWAAAGSSESTLVLDSLMGMASRIREPIQFQENWLQTTQALRTGWSLPIVFRSWGIVDREHLSRWLGEHGFPATQPGNHEALLNEGCRFDVRVALVEVVCVNVAIHMQRVVLSMLLHRPRGAVSWKKRIGAKV